MSVCCLTNFYVSQKCGFVLCVCVGGGGGGGGGGHERMLSNRFLCQSEVWFRFLWP